MFKRYGDGARVMDPSIRLRRTPKSRKLCLVLYVRYRLSRIRTGSVRIGNFESLKWSAACCFSICGGHGTTHTNTFSKLRCADGSAKHCKTDTVSSPKIDQRQRHQTLQSIWVSKILTMPNSSSIIEVT
jgi:hypothetical protein